MLNAYRQLDKDGFEIWYEIDADEKAKRLVESGHHIEWKPNDPFNQSEWKPYGLRHITEKTYNKVKSMRYSTAMCYVCGKTYLKVKKANTYQEYLNLKEG